MRLGTKKCAPNRTSRVGRIVQLSIGRSVKGRSTARGNVLHLSGVFPSNANFEVLFAFAVCFCRSHWVWGLHSREQYARPFPNQAAEKCFQRIGQVVVEMTLRMPNTASCGRHNVTFRQRARVAFAVE